MKTLRNKIALMLVNLAKLFNKDIKLCKCKKLRVKRYTKK